MAAVPIFPRSAVTNTAALTTHNSLPPVLQTPSGLALVEIQGTINLPAQALLAANHPASHASSTPIGRLVFPDYPPLDPASTAWHKRVHLYIGMHQRMTGEIRKLPRAIAVLRRRRDGHAQAELPPVGVEDEALPTALEVAEIVRWKLIFSSRPEPVGTDELVG